MDINDIPLLIEHVDIDSYRAANRKIRHLLKGASERLVAMVIGFAYDKELAIPSSHKKGWQPRQAALDRLIEAGFVERLHGGWHDIAGGRGRCGIYRRTDLFDKTFRFRLLPRLVVTASTLIAHEDKTRVHNGINVNSIPALSTYSKLIEGVELSLSNGGQVFKQVVLSRSNGKRLYAVGTYNYQNELPKEERPNLLINGEPTVELDFSALHGNMLLNRTGEPYRKDFYERILVELGLAPIKEKRDAIKPLTVIMFNVDKKEYGGALWRAHDDKYKRYVKTLGVKPKQVYEAVLRAYPTLAPYVCSGKQWEWLQTTDSEIMIDVLETLAKQGILGLPVHDSVIAPAKHTDALKQAMSDCYKAKMGFEPCIK